MNVDDNNLTWGRINLEPWIFNYAHFSFVQSTYKLDSLHSKIRVNVVEFEAVGYHSPREGASLVSERAELLTPDSDLSECRVSIWARLEWLPGAARLPAYWDLMNLFRAYTEWKDSQGCFLSCYRRTIKTVRLS